MISYDEVFSQLDKLIPLDSEESDRMKFFCESAVSTMNSRIKHNADASDKRLILATAALAYYRYLQMLHDEESDMVSMKAGDVTVRRNADAIVKKAKHLWEEALLDVGDLLDDTSFIFTAT